ncbi:MAG TPA: SGNH/GDSL hydrolase family protein [Usitatibacter sp.]|nr:SGNH/GDSL hydrolase family protein [Usitatibacter sp.]
MSFSRLVPRALAAFITAAALLGALAAEAATTVLFIGNSFTYAHGSPVRFYRAGTVTDMNGEGIGGVPALFKSFAQQAGLDYDVFLETRGGAGLDFHLGNKLGVIGRRGWDKVVMHGFSTLDYEKPRDPAKLIATSRQMADFLRTRNPKVEIYLMATFPRADETYRPEGAWAGQPIEAMARDVRAAYDRAAESAAARAVIPVGEAWIRAMQAGVADPNPYDGIEPGKLDLWTYDHYHASAYGYYLEALVVFGSLTGRDPRSLGDNECSAYELGFSREQVRALQQVAFDQLAGAGAVTPDPLVLPKPVGSVPCVRGH